MKEARNLERFDLELPAKIEIVGHEKEKENKVLTLLTRNVCSGGAYFHTEQPLPEGTDVKLDLILAIEELKKLKGKQAYIKVSGKVIRTEPNGMAICFNNDYSMKSL
ncbi:MAG: PilZ domain-containing protein [Deltaproteobacteria bacterium]|nr:PilZ domain-containing protein [Deltaproteobacteria bacterium]MBW2052948.1 PilZ domain-containing protein [Deltaproteobacteria bacterium]MBW2141566.1 PilZ domain-containing protein [Deltaproteobacteria bacterium]MBW2323173.1 PilZ domain-containing protein [Deltaproteobacteria bacterium]